MSDVEFTYTSSSWTLPLILCCLISVGFAVIAWNRGRELLQFGALRTFFILFVVLNLAAVGAGLFVSRASPTDQPWLVIHRDYLVCGSWRSDGRYMRVPWHAFTDISRAPWSRPRFLEVDLRFNLDPRHLAEVPWTGWVKSSGQVECLISWLTDDPWRLGFADTSEIQAHVEAAWRASFQRPPVSYHDLMSEPPKTSQR